MKSWNFNSGWCVSRALLFLQHLHQFTWRWGGDLLFPHLQPRTSWERAQKAVNNSFLYTSVPLPPPPPSETVVTPKSYQINLCFAIGYPGASQVVLLVKNRPACSEDVRDMGLIPGLGRSPGGRLGNPLQYSCLENSVDIYR